MKGKSALFWLGLAAAAGGVLFQTSYEVQELEEKLASVNRRITAEQEAIQILKAEWSFLNDPTRLENLSRAHLALQPTDARQFVALDIVPMRPAPPPEAVPAPIPGKPGNGGPAPLPPMAGLGAGGHGRLAPIAPMPTAHTPVNDGKAVIVPASAPARPAPIKPAAVIPAAAKAPALPSSAQNPAAPNQATPTAVKAPPPQNTTRPVDIAARPLAPPPKVLTPPPAARPQPTSAAVPAPTDSLGLLVARLGANR